MDHLFNLFYIFYNLKKLEVSEDEKIFFEKKWQFFQENIKLTQELAKIHLHEVTYLEAFTHLFNSLILKIYHSFSQH